MSGSTARLRAIAAVTGYEPTSPTLSFTDTPAGELWVDHTSEAAESGRVELLGPLWALP